MQLKKRQIAFLLFLIVATAFILLNRNGLTKVTFRTAEGSIFGTTYHIKYEAAQPLDSLILGTLRRVDNSLSLFNQQHGSRDMDVYALPYASRHDEGLRHLLL